MITQSEIWTSTRIRAESFAVEGRRFVGDFSGLLKAPLKHNYDRLLIDSIKQSSEL
jgi:hypothetical protein